MCQFRVSRIFAFFGLSHFKICFGTPRLKIKLINLATESFLGNDAELRNEYISNIEKGAYLHKYAGLWALGLDLLPTSAHRSLDLFVYKGCVCSTGALVML